VMFFNNLQVFLKCFKDCQEVLVAISKRFVLIDKGIGFILEGLKSSIFTILG